MRECSTRLSNSTGEHVIFHIFNFRMWGEWFEFLWQIAFVNTVIDHHQLTQSPPASISTSPQFSCSSESLSSVFLNSQANKNLSHEIRNVPLWEVPDKDVWDSNGICPSSTNREWMVCGNIAHRDWHFSFETSQFRDCYLFFDGLVSENLVSEKKSQFRLSKI